MQVIPSKIVGRQSYWHIDQVARLNLETQARIAEAERLAGVNRLVQFNLVRLEADGGRIALLNYPTFDTDPFPALRESWLVDRTLGTVSYRTYAESLNPPILHRKELLLPSEHPQRDDCVALTTACESIGLFDDPRRIGYRRQWLALIREKGYRLEGHALVPLGNDDADAPEADDTPAHAGWQASRQLTALVRYGFSAPIQSLARHGFLDGRYRLFDYGCGRGDDVRGLVENGLTAAGWDPFHAPDQPLQSADIVNLGFVINVIEDCDERLEALTRAWSLAERLLVVAVMLANQNDPRGQPFRDGVMTQRGTFQKYFSQAEIKSLLEQTLDAEAIPVAPGVLYVFRDQDAEQRFLIERYRSRRNRLRDASSPVRERAPNVRRERAAEKYDLWREPLEQLWERWLSLGRPPDKVDVGEDLLALIEGFGSLPKALRFLGQCHDLAKIERAAAVRIADLEVYFALQQFARRTPYRHLERELQQDIKVFFGSDVTANAQARERLFQIADCAAIDAACRTAAEQGLGWLNPGHSLQLHGSLVEQLPPLLRVYVGCAAVLYGDYRHADLVKIHIRSGKVSLMRYDDFAGQPLPRLVERVKIRLRDLDIDYFAYGEDYAPPFLFHKSRYINEEFAQYPEQVAFEQALDALGICDLSGYGPPPGVFLDTLARRRWCIAGFDLMRPETLPDLDDPCGQFLSFRELIACGETQAATGLPNLPRQSASYDALLALAEQVLDPVIEYFGMIRLTYGFCSPELARQIPGRIDPQRDQHAAHELNRLGRLICPRLGAAVDFIVEDENMLDVAQWIVANTPFDRLYVYGDDLPLHVSYGPNQDRQIVRMVAGKSGRLLPRVVTAEHFLSPDG